MIFKKFYYTLFTILFITSCATYAPQYKDKEANPVYPSTKEIEKTFYLVGDAGLSPMGGMSDALLTFNNYLETEKTPGNYTIYLGDNIYPSGMDPEGHPRREASENMIDAQYKAVKDYAGNTIFIPGNHEWYNNGVIGVAREENYVETLFPDQDAFRPSNGCPLESVAISENIQLIVIDTQWYLEDWNKNPTINKNCDIKTREKFFLELQLALEKNQNKTVVFAMHHPMFTNGNHGGYFALPKHLYPLQSKIPMPVLASLVVQVRSQGGVSVQDRYNELYNKLMNKLQELVKNNNRLVFVSGHDHNMQYIERDGLKQIVSGSGAKESYAAIGQDGLYSTGAQGFAVLDVFKDGSSWVRFYVKGDNHQPVLQFQKEIIAAPTVNDVSKYPRIFPKEKTVPIYKQDSINEVLFFNTVWGGKYKDTYATPVKAKVASLDTLYGGLHVLREHKDKDYNSLLLTDKKGNRYRLRSMGKNALEISKKIVFSDTETEGIEDKQIDEPSVKGQDLSFYTASHPYSVMAVPDMARAIDVFYTTPQLFYVPKQQRLGQYNESFGDALYLISIEPSESSEGEGLFQYPDDVETTDDILVKLRETGDVLVDEENYIKSRLFDMLIGNWDRQPGYWRWAEYYNQYQQNVYVPIPDNRDNAFSSYEGNILDITRSLFSGSLQRHVYDEDLTNFQWFNKEGVILDRALLENSGRRQWQRMAKMIQDSLTDAVIEKAFNSVPEEVQNEALADIKTKLKKRRDNLAKIANDYYAYLATLQTIVGTDGNDVFEITRLPNGQTNVISYTESRGKIADTLINRTYNNKDTKELWIYGLKGDDKFTVAGDENNLIYLRIIGGHGLDTYSLHNGKKTKVYDFESMPSTVTTKKGGSLRFTDVYNLNTYDYRKQIKRKGGLVSAIGYNPDDGFRAALQYVYRVDKFTRNPFSQKHVFNAANFTDINSFEISYLGEVANVKDNLNLSFGARITSPNFTRNYFGFGNETENMQDERGYAYNRIEVQHISGNVGLLRNSKFGSFFKVQTTFDAYKVDDSPSNIIATVPLQNKGEPSYFGTLEGIYNYRSFDDPQNPTIGMMFDLNAGITDNLEAIEDVFGFVKTRLGFYNTLVRNRTLVLKTNLSYHQNLGKKYEFYQAANLGGDNGLRGFREQRFTGKSFLVGNADLRYSLPKFNIGLVPVQVGVYGGFDVGRVWVANNTSRKWHISRGGGVWINGSGGLNANVSLFNSEEGSRLTFGLGFDF